MKISNINIQVAIILASAYALAVLALFPVALSMGQEKNFLVAAAYVVPVLVAIYGLTYLLDKIF